MPQQLAETFIEQAGEPCQLGQGPASTMGGPSMPAAWSFLLFAGSRKGRTYIIYFASAYAFYEGIFVVGTALFYLSYILVISSGRNTPADQT